MPKLRARVLYKNREVVYQPGQIFDVSEEERRFLMADSPESFEDYDPATEVKAKPAPPADKQVKASSTTRKRKAAVKKK